MGRKYSYFDSFCNMDGSNTSISTSGSPELAASIASRTGAQARPPFPQPSAGSAILRMPSCLVTRTRSARPVCTHSIVEGYRQCFFVGKLMIQCKPSSRAVSTTNIFPTATSLRWQAAWYAAKLSGNAFLNWRAIPLPITPSVLTALTNASTLVARRFPCM
jgi:hypothetical protein